MAFRTSSALGPPERCSIDANRASARTALALGRYITSCIFSPLTSWPPALTTLERVGAGGVPLTDELRPPDGRTSPPPGTPRGVRPATHTGSAAATARATGGARRDDGARPGLSLIDPRCRRSSVPPRHRRARSATFVHIAFVLIKVSFRGYDHAGCTAVTRALWRGLSWRQRPITSPPKRSPTPPSTRRPAGQQLRAPGSRCRAGPGRLPPPAAG
jgi:hypothetical protein